MNPVAHIDQPRQTTRPRIATAAWDDFETTARRRRRPTATVLPAPYRARVRHAHLSWSETPDLFLREEMA
jgi:hypothetical protein